MSTDADRAPVRLAELVAALSLGVDLGFGQPMEHVLRQTLMAVSGTGTSMHGSRDVNTGASAHRGSVVIRNRTGGAPG